MLDIVAMSHQSVPTITVTANEDASHLSHPGGTAGKGDNFGAPETAADRLASRAHHSLRIDAKGVLQGGRSRRYQIGSTASINCSLSSVGAPCVDEELLVPRTTLLGKLPADVASTVREAPAGDPAAKTLGRNLDRAKETHQILREYHEGGISERRKDALWTRFVELNFASTRGAYLVRLRSHLEQQNADCADAQLRGFRKKNPSSGFSQVDLQVFAVLSEWFLNPKVVANYKSDLGVLLSTWRKQDIKRDVMNFLVDARFVDLATDDDGDGEHEDDWEREVFRRGAVRNEELEYEVDAAEAVESSVVLDVRAIGDEVEEALLALASKGTEESAAFVQLLHALEELVASRSISVRDRLVFLVSLCHSGETAGQVGGVSANFARQIKLRVRTKLESLCKARGDSLAGLALVCKEIQESRVAKRKSHRKK